MCQCYFLLYGLVVTPYLALLPEISSSRSERLNLTTGQGFATLAGTMLFALSGVVIQKFGYPALGLMLTIAVLLSFYPLTAVISEPRHPEHSKSSLADLFRWIWEVLTNRDFLPLLISTSFYWFALNLLLMLVPRWVEARLGMSKEAVTWLMLPFIGVNLLGFFFFNWFAKRAGKFVALVCVFLGSALMFALFGWSDRLGLPAAPLVCAQVVTGLAGLPVAGFGVVAFALLADVIDADTARTGIRREAIYFGVQAILQKSMIGFSVVTFAFLQRAPGTTGLGWTSLLAGASCLCCTASLHADGGCLLLFRGSKRRLRGLGNCLAYCACLFSVVGAGESCSGRFGQLDQKRARNKRRDHCCDLSGLASRQSCSCHLELRYQQTSDGIAAGVVPRRSRAARADCPTRIAVGDRLASTVGEGRTCR